ncbi:hypothetical protein HAX54_023028 [Datura stramonium]|uniref:RNase H type-1 domain-containing protein n=1 Tax=Datura stramonium TaxID=4076 RepID=A0ABS8UVS5_DATST|nr:hypothetical protein [Datura stramonium]
MVADLGVAEMGVRGFRGADGRGVVAFLIPLFHLSGSFELLERSKILRRLILIRRSWKTGKKQTSDEEEDELPEDNNEKESVRESCEVDLDEHSIKLFFKGISIAGSGDSGCRMSGIGVVMERAESAPPIQIQKKLYFYVEEFVAEYLALMDGLLEAVKSKMRKVYVFTDFEILYQQVRSLFSTRYVYLNVVYFQFLLHSIFNGLNLYLCAMVFTFATGVSVDGQLPLLPPSNIFILMKVLCL